jgi:hypothetical protein
MRKGVIFLYLGPVKGLLGAVREWMRLQLN